MAWEYSQSTGILTHNGRHVATGYSGHDRARTTPTCRTCRTLGHARRGATDWPAEGR